MHSFKTYIVYTRLMFRNQSINIIVILKVWIYYSKRFTKFKLFEL